MKECLLTVEQRDDRRWHVCEGGVLRSLASFGLRQDAVEYAPDLAAAELHAAEGAAKGNGSGNGRREKAGA